MLISYPVLAFTIHRTLGSVDVDTSSNEAIYLSFRIIIMDNDDNATNVTNVSIMPFGRIILKNGTYINVSTMDELFYLIYNGSINVEDIEQVNVSTISDYLEYMDSIMANESESINLTYYPLHRVFLSRLEKKLENYSGLIVPVNAEDYIYDEYGSKYPKSFYGVIPCLNISNGDGDINVLDEGYRLYLIVYANLSYMNDVLGIEEMLNSIIEIDAESIFSLIVDISNTYNNSNEQENTNIMIVNDNVTYIYNRSSNGTLYEFTTINNTFLPLVVIIDDQGVIWWKHYGLENLDELKIYVSMYLKEGFLSIPKYPVLDIIPDEPQVNKTCDVYVILGYGFGNISEIKLYYELRDENNDTITYCAEPIDVPTDKFMCELPKINSTARWLVLNATVRSEFGDYKSKMYIYKIIVPKKKEKEIPEWVWKLVATIIIVVIGISLCIRLYRRYVKLPKK